MIKISRLPRLVAVFVVMPAVAACQSILPGDGPSLLAQQRVTDSGPSGQRLGPDGYPLVGAYPDAAAAQLPEATIVGERALLTATGAAQNAAVPLGSAEYQRSLAELEVVKADQRKALAAAIAADAPGPETGTDDPADVLRRIEGR